MWSLFGRWLGCKSTNSPESGQRPQQTACCWFPLARRAWGWQRRLPGRGARFCPPVARSPPAVTSMALPSSTGCGPQVQVEWPRPGQIAAFHILKTTSPGPLWASKGPLPRSGLGEAEWDLTVGSEFPLNSFFHWRVSHPHLGRGELLVWAHNCWAASSWVAGGGPSCFKCWVMGRLGPRLTVSGCGR